MTRRSWPELTIISAVFALLAVAAPSARAANGVVQIDQSKVTVAGGFPFKISAPGSYILTGNLTVPSAVDAIDIVATDPVTLDLNGFTITGNTIALTFGINSNSSHLTMRNGTIRHFQTLIQANSGGLSMDDLILKDTDIAVITGTSASTDLIHVIISSANVGIEGLDDLLVYECAINVTLFAVGGSGNGAAVMVNNNIITGNTGIFTGLMGAIFQNNINPASSAPIVAVENTPSPGASVALGRNSINTNAGGTCVTGTVVSVGDNVCNGVKQ